MYEEDRAEAAAPPTAAPEADTPRPPRPVRILLALWEGLAWAGAGVIVVGLVLHLVLTVRGTVLESAQVLDGGRITELSGGAVEGGYLDVVLTGVPLSVSWPYLVWFTAAGCAWILLFALIALLGRGLRRGRPFGGLRPGLLFVFAAVWTALAFAGPMVLNAVRPAMAQAAGVMVPGATFSYTMTFGDLLSVLAGPLISVLVGVFAAGSRMWHEQRTLV